MKEKKEFEKSFQIVKELLKYEERLPKQIFKEPLNYYYICDIDNAMGGPFEDVLRNLAFISNDDYIIMGMLNPDPVTYYYKEFGYYNWLHIPANMPEDYYWDMLNVEPNQSPPDALLFNSFVMVWASPSKQWAIWGERDYGIAVLGFHKDGVMRQQIHENEIWRKMDDEVADLISLNFRGFTLPKDIKEELFLHYQNR
ncbi:diadenosine tetraphosphatase [Paenibacillus popilliae]|uniref:diadenosine tetraphosphatase n=1 Tax=Paenibacillus popilliae TaxID=78057 RepID=UPI001F304C96|nr:diadenosine tetraphosphatase [Paenibacillus popilliae]